MHEGINSNEVVHPALNCCGYFPQGAIKFQSAHACAMAKTVIISGASSGIGLSAAVIFAKHGWKTFAGVRTSSKKKDIVEGENHLSL